MPQNLTAFSIVLGMIVTVLELYVIGHWTAYVRRENMSRWLYQAAWISSSIMLSVYWYVVFPKHFGRMQATEILIFGFVAFWSVPKFFIAAALLVRDVTRGIKFIVRRLTSTTNADADSPLAHSPLADGPVAERRAFLARAGWTLTAVPYVIVGKSLWHTLYDFRVYNEEIWLPNLPKAMNGFRIVQISDVHAGSFPDHKPFQEVRRIVESLKPDALVITGDFVNAQPDELRIVEKDLSALAAGMPVYASLGNHDHYHTAAEHRKLIAGMRELGVDLLVNSNRRIGSGSNTLVIAGTDNTGFKQEYAELQKALQGTTADDAVVLLAHDPTFWDKEVVGSDVGLMLAGHTHGGQFGVQLGNFEWSPAKMVYKQSAGLYKRGHQSLYVNRGVGTVGPPMRIGIPPEITVITLRS